MSSILPSIVDLLRSPEAIDVFAPAEWRGLKIAPTDLETKDSLPDRLSYKVRPVRPQLLAQAKEEFDRLSKYMFVPSTSVYAAPLTIAAKPSTTPGGPPGMRFCGDFRGINQYIKIPPYPIPQPHLKLTQSLGFTIFADMDMTNSFHQIPLTKRSSSLLAIQTPWGLVEPLFLPEGVGPASGMLQRTVTDIFKPHLDWLIVIFDNFLVCATDFDDLHKKLKIVIHICHEYRMILKFKKTWIGVREVTFFGFKVYDGKWELSEKRIEAIKAIIFPTSKKLMQSFLGAALFFHHHIPNYSEWVAKLYEMTREDFVWKPEQWTFDYPGHFEKFKEALLASYTLHFPDYSLPWKVRTDASNISCAGILFQEATLPSGEIQNQLIDCCSHTFSGAALNWDIRKKECYGLYYSCDKFVYYLRGKFFILQTDHRNLQWLEKSTSPMVIRMRIAMQSLHFQVEHIRTSEMGFPDHLSRQYEKTPASLLLLDENDEELEMLPTFDEVMKKVHGGRKLHFGAHETWRRAKQLYPNVKISLQAVLEWVKLCPICQKLRDMRVRGLQPITLNLKPPTYRKRVGIDHMTITPVDKYGNKCAIMIVEHFPRFPQVYPAKDYSTDEVATALFVHYCTFGLYDEIISDPGSPLVSEAVLKLNEWLGVEQKVSLVGRHESNGCEGPNKIYMRHLGALFLEKRIRNEWSSKHVLPLINFAMCSFPTSETGCIRDIVTDVALT